MLKSFSLYFKCQLYISVRELGSKSSLRAALTKQSTTETVESNPRSWKIYYKYGKTPAFMKRKPEAFDIHVKSLSARFGVPEEKILDYPGIIYLTPVQFEHRYNILKYYGFQPITCETFSNIAELMRNSPADLLASNILSNDPVVHVLAYLPQEIREVIGKQLSKNIYFNWPLLVIHKGLITLLLSARLQYSLKEAVIALRCKSITKRSIVDLYETIQALVETFGFSSETLKNTPSHLIMDVRNLQEIANDLELKKGFSTVLQNNPFILRKETQKIQSVLQFCLEAGLTEEQLTKCKPIFGVPIETLKERFTEIDNILEFRILKHDPSFANLVVYLPLAKRNLEKLKSAGLNNWTMYKIQNTKPSSNFKDICTGKEAVRILSHFLDKSPEDVQTRLRTHPKFCHVSYVNAHLLIQGLSERGITREQLWNAPFIVLYNHEMVLQLISGMETFAELQPFEKWQTNPLLLHLVIYYIERNCRFSFDGIYSRTEFTE